MSTDFTIQKGLLRLRHQPELCGWPSPRSSGLLSFPTINESRTVRKTADIVLSQTPCVAHILLTEDEAPSARDVKPRSREIAAHLATRGGTVMYVGTLVSVGLSDPRNVQSMSTSAQPCSSRHAAGCG